MQEAEPVELLARNRLKTEEGSVVARNRSLMSPKKRKPKKGRFQKHLLEGEKDLNINRMSKRCVSRRNTERWKYREE